MANKLAENPMVIDTAAAAALFTGELLITQFEFIDYALDTDTVEVQNGNGQTVWKANGASDLSPVRSGNIGWINGMKVVTLAANSKLLMWFR